MEKPSSSDPNFKAFLNKLKEQNGGGILAQKETTKGDDKTNESLDELKDETSSVRDSLREEITSSSCSSLLSPSSPAISRSAFN